MCTGAAVDSDRFLFFFAASRTEQPTLRFASAATRSACTVCSALLRFELARIASASTQNSVPDTEWINVILEPHRETSLAQEAVTLTRPL